VYATDAAVTPKVRVAGTFPADSHQAITYPSAVVAGHDTAAARDFNAWLRGDDARSIFNRYGFTVR
jgi:molybdate transport system substrate-binding protein